MGILSKISISIIYIILFFCAGYCVPRFLKEPFPHFWGIIESKVGGDITGFWFTPWFGQGNCRIINSKAALEIDGSKIVFGMVTRQDGESYPHLWATNGANIIDYTCPMTVSSCRNRKVFAVINPQTLVIEYQNASNNAEEHQIEWGISYLSGFKNNVY